MTWKSISKEKKKSKSTANREIRYEIGDSFIIYLIFPEEMISVPFLFSQKAIFIDLRVLKDYYEGTYLYWNGGKLWN